MINLPPDMATLSPSRVRELIQAASQCRILVVGDVMLDQFIWGRVTRISPEAPVPVVDFERESFMPGGAANVARNLTALGGKAELFGLVGRDSAAKQLQTLLGKQNVACKGLLALDGRPTITKTRIVAGQQQIARLDREVRGDLDAKATSALLKQIRPALRKADAVIIGDYGKGVVTQPLIQALSVPRASG